jgi:hypothetical protein
LVPIWAKAAWIRWKSALSWTTCDAGWGMESSFLGKTKGIGLLGGSDRNAMQNGRPAGPQARRLDQPTR